MQLHFCCCYEYLSCWTLYIKLYSSTDLHHQSVQLVKRGNVLFTTDAVQWYFQLSTANVYFQTIPVDKCIAPAVVHCVKGYSYSAAREVLWLYSIAPAEELCVKGDYYIHIPLCTQDHSWQGPQKVAFWVWRQIGSILARGIANCLLVTLQSNVKRTYCLITVLLDGGSWGRSIHSEVPSVEQTAAILGSRSRSCSRNKSFHRVRNLVLGPQTEQE